jgi:CheY-like chemotaxis protein/uncharacterized membrane protein YeaQ/YmgE (transglycosylase-associated protein family)
MGILLISSIIVGAIAGLLARLILRRFLPDPILTLTGAVLVGILGASLASFARYLLLGFYGLNLLSILVATMGSILLLVIYVLVKVATVRTYRGNADTSRSSQRDNLAANAEMQRTPEEPQRAPEEPQRLRQSEEPGRQETKAIFISYRRDETAGYAGRIADRFIEHFGEDRVFRDLDSLEPGLDFAEVIQSAVDSTEVMIAVIGKNWVTATDAAGRKRLEDPDDYVRVEIATALKRNTRVIPLLVQGAAMPSAEELPEDLAPLTRRNAFELHDFSWNEEVQRLITTLDKVLGRTNLRERYLLWVDDNPDNNRSERHRMERQGATITLATSTEEALNKVGQESYDVIISDMGRREGGSENYKAGYDLLDNLQRLEVRTPFIFYSGRNALTSAESESRGAFGSTSNPDKLLQLVSNAVHNIRNS